MSRRSRRQHQDRARRVWFARYADARRAERNLREDRRRGHRRPDEPLPAGYMRHWDACAGFRLDRLNPDYLQVHEHTSYVTHSLTHSLRMRELRNHPKLP